MLAPMMRAKSRLPAPQTQHKPGRNNPGVCGSGKKHTYAAVGEGRAGKIDRARRSGSLPVRRANASSAGQSARSPPTVINATSTSMRSALAISWASAAPRLGSARLRVRRVLTASGVCGLGSCTPRKISRSSSPASETWSSASAASGANCRNAASTPLTMAICLCGRSAAGTDESTRATCSAT
jgi:hypothetical protein